MAADDKSSQQALAGWQAARRAGSQSTTAVTTSRGLRQVTHQRALSRSRSGRFEKRHVHRTVQRIRTRMFGMSGVGEACSERHHRDRELPPGGPRSGTNDMPLAVRPVGEICRAVTRRYCSQVGAGRGAGVTRALRQAHSASRGGAILGGVGCRLTLRCDRLMGVVFIKFSPLSAQAVLRSLRDRGRLLPAGRRELCGAHPPKAALALRPQ